MRHWCLRARGSSAGGKGVCSAILAYLGLRVPPCQFLVICLLPCLLIKWPLWPIQSNSGVRCLYWGMRGVIELAISELTIPMSCMLWGHCTVLGLITQPFPFCTKSCKFSRFLQSYKDHEGILEYVMLACRDSLRGVDTTLVVGDPSVNRLTLHVIHPSLTDKYHEALQVV